MDKEHTSKTLPFHVLQNSIIIAQLKINSNVIMTTLADWTPLDSKYCLFFGAGFSKWAANLPTAVELFDFNIEPWGPREEKRLEDIKKIKISWDIENPNGNPEEFIRELIESGPKESKLVHWYICRRLADPFIRVDHYRGRSERHVLMIDEYRKYEIQGVKEAQRFIEPLLSVSLEGIITTNYDLLIEYALGTKRFNYGRRGSILHGRGAYPVSTWRGPVMLEGPLPLIKLHGSISLTEEGYCTDGRGGITGKAIIIPPTQNKKIMGFVTQEWKYAEEILDKSRTIIFFGFAFNEYDQSILSLLRGTGEQIKKIILINRNPATQQHAQIIWPSAEVILVKPDGIKEFSIQNLFW